jgi:hypothetical protein
MDSIRNAAFISIGESHLAGWCTSPAVTTCRCTSWCATVCGLPCSNTPCSNTGDPACTVCHTVLVHARLPVFTSSRSRALFLGGHMDIFANLATILIALSTRVEPGESLFGCTPKHVWDGPFSERSQFLFCFCLLGGSVSRLPPTPTPSPLLFIVLAAWWGQRVAVNTCTCALYSEICRLLATCKFV